MESKIFKEIMKAWLGGPLLPELSRDDFYITREYELYATCRAVQICRMEINEIMKRGQQYASHALYQRTILANLEEQFQKLLTD